MLDIAFWYEFRRRADILIWLALLNPLLLGAYAASAELDRPALEFWLIGLGMTFLVCLAGALCLYAFTAATIRKGLGAVLREKQWNDIIRRGPFMRDVTKATEPG